MWKGAHSYSSLAKLEIELHMKNEIKAQNISCFSFFYEYIMQKDNFGAE
jgi:hypothetical protein